MKKGLSAPLVASLFVTLLVLGSVAFFVQPVQDWIVSRQYHKKAIGKAVWGMSESQVAKAQSVTLESPTNRNRYYTPVNGMESRYTVWKQAELDFLGESAEVHYVFFDDRLYACHVALKGRDPAALEALIQEYLIKRFGKVNTRLSDEGPLRMIWHLREVIVNYWLVKNPLSLTGPYEAVFGIVYQPIERSIPS